jgi:hypothetical protein
MSARKPSRGLVASVRKTTKDMHWLTPADKAAVDLAIRYAQEIEAAVDSGDEQQRSKMLGWLGPHLMNTLKSLGGTPESRAGMHVESEVKGKLALLRDSRSA